MKWKFPTPALVATVALGLLPIGCGRPADPAAAEKPKYPPGQDPEIDYLPGTSGDTRKPAR